MRLQIMRPPDEDTADTAPYVDGDDDLEELNDRIDPDDLDDYEDLVEHRAHNTPIPADSRRRFGTRRRHPDAD